MPSKINAIEHKGSIPHKFRSAMGNWLFGCDVCQDVCPHNGKNFDSNGNLQDLAPKPKQPFVDLRWLLESHDELVDDYFAGTPLRRAGARQLKRNACIVAGNIGDGKLQVSLEKIRSSKDTLLVEHANWALERVSS